MAGDGSDGRFKSAMDKLLQLEALTNRAASSTVAPRQTAAKSGTRRSPLLDRGVSAETPTSSTPMCRPWERADLLRRLASFKSSMWFGKPLAAGPVACARRGWVNIDSDMIACEGCGAHLSFVVPPTWSRQQANKVAEDFAKRLETAHRELCAWQGNACPETLVQFPPTTSATLQAAYNERCERLMELPALPQVAAEALETMRLSRGAQITKLLSQSGPSPSKSPGEVQGPANGAILPLLEDAGANSHFYESLHLIALCGWEPRLLPAGIQPPALPHSSPSSQTASLSSAVLDCGMCGASVGLWSFSAIARPRVGPAYNPGPAVAEIDEMGEALQVDEEAEEQPTRNTAHRPTKEDKEQPTQSTGHNSKSDAAKLQHQTSGREIMSPPSACPKKPSQDEADSKQAGSMQAPAARGRRGLPPQQKKSEMQQQKGRRKSEVPEEKAVKEVKSTKDATSVPSKEKPDASKGKGNEEAGPGHASKPAEKGEGDVKPTRMENANSIDLSPTKLLPLGAPSLADLAWSTIAGGTTAAAIGEQVPEQSGPFGRKVTKDVAKPDTSSKPDPETKSKKRKASDENAEGDSKSDGNDNQNGGAIQTVVASNARPPRSPIVDLSLTIAGGPPPSPVGDFARPIFGPGAIMRAPVFGSLAQEPVQAASFESRGAPNPQDLAPGFSQGISHDAKMSHFSPAIAGGSTVTTPHTRTLKRKPADSAEGMVLENDGGDDEMEVEGGGRMAIPAHLMVRGSSRFSRPANREARPQETTGVESVNVDIGGSVEARGAPDARLGREASVSGVAGDREGSVDTRYRRLASREVEGEPSVDVMDSAAGTSVAVVEEVEEVMGAPRTKRRRVAEQVWRGGQVGRLAAEGSPGEGDLPRTSSVNATATNHSYEKPETSTESVRNMPRADSDDGVQNMDEGAPNDDEATTRLVSPRRKASEGVLQIEKESVQPARSASDRFEDLGFQGFGALPEEGVVSTGVAVSLGMGEGESEERGAMGSEGLGAGGSTGKEAGPPSLGGSTRAGYGRVGSIGPGGGHSFAGEAGYDTEEATPTGVARPWSGGGTEVHEAQLEQSIIHTPVRGLIVREEKSSGSEGGGRKLALNDNTPRRTFTNGTAEAEVRGGDEEELADAEGGLAPQEIVPPIFVEPRPPAPPASSLRLPSFVASPARGVVQPAEFDPLGQHRHFCPWVNANAVGRGRELVLAGWQRCLDALTTTREEARPAVSSRQDTESTGSFARTEYGTSAASLLRAALTRRNSLDESRM